MGLLSFIGKIVATAGAAVALVTVLPIAGAVGAITATGAAVASNVGAVAGATEYVIEEKNK